METTNQSSTTQTTSDLLGPLILLMFGAFFLIIFYLALGSAGVIAGTIIGATFYLGEKLNDIIKVLEKNNSSGSESTK